MKWILPLAVLGILFAPLLAHAQLGSGTGTTALNVTVGAEAGLTVGATTSLASTGSNFGIYTGSSSLTYYIRTTQTTGSGNIQLKVTTDFTPTGGPSVTTPPTSGDALTYSCTVANPGNSGTATACTSPTTASSGSSTSVAAFGANNRSLITGNTATVNWSLTNDPKYQTGAYSATVTFTISAS